MGDVNISAILDSFSVSYDKRVRPNYGGEYSANLFEDNLGGNCACYVNQGALLLAARVL